jgi:hypothetical protein
MVQWDVDSIRARVLNRLRSKASWANVLDYSANTREIDAFSEELADLANYLEYNNRETTWTLARNKSSLLASQAIHGYKAHRKIGATGTIRFAVSDLIKSASWYSTTTYAQDDVIYYSDDILYRSLVNNNLNHVPSSTIGTYWELVDIKPSKNIDIPKWTVFTDEAGEVKFTTYETNALTTSDNWIDLNVIQGSPISVSKVAQGTENEEFEIDDDSIETSKYNLTVNSVEWTEIDSLQESGSTDTEYEIENIIDFTGLYLKFGDDIHGKQLTTGDSVIFNYVQTLGLAGNVASAGIITKISSTIYDEDGVVVTPYCTNIEALLGGQETEEIESIRVNAPKIFQAGDRASSYADYESIILNNFSFVLKVLVWGSYEYNVDNGLNPWTFVPTEENVVHLAAISQSEIELTTTQKYLISEGINAYKSPTDIVVFSTPRFINVAFITTAYISDTSYTLSQVVSSIRTALGNAYSVSALDFFENIYFSDYQTLIDQVAGVEHHTTYAQIYYDFYFNDGSYTADLDLPSVDVRASSVYIYIQDTVGGQTDWTLLATDNGTGVLTTPNGSGFTLSSSTINYTTGIAVINVASGLTEDDANYTIRVKYRLDSDDLILNNRADIFKYDNDESSITAQYLRR